MPAKWGDIREQHGTCDVIFDYFRNGEFVRSSIFVGSCSEQIFIEYKKSVRGSLASVLAICSSDLPKTDLAKLPYLPVESTLGRLPNPFRIEMECHYLTSET